MASRTAGGNADNSSQIAPARLKAPQTLRSSVRAMRRRLLIPPAILTLWLLPALAAAQGFDLRYEALAEKERALIDLMAADFYEKSLRTSQARAIEARTAALYRGRPEEARASFRAARRARWREMGEPSRTALRGAKEPVFDHLAEEQKTPFRSIALDRLGAAGAIDAAALAEALSKDI